MKKTILFPFIFFVLISFAQKKVIPVTQSALSGISLPNGSKQDNRMLSVSGAKMILEMESKKAQISLSTTEVLVLPPATAGGFTADSLVSKLSGLGWNITVVEGDNKYAWLQKENRHLIMYFSMDAKETGLYIAEASSAPVQNGQGITTGNNQPATAENNRPQQTNNPPVQNNQVDFPQQPSQAIQNTGFAFTTTNFDDGWTSTVQEDWVEVTKGNTRVLVHYPNKKADVYNSVVLDGLKNAWDVLVAPRYSTATNFEFKPISSWQTIEFAEADCIERISGKTVHVVLFKYNYYSGGGKYLEFITIDKSSFEQEFGAYHESTSGWDKMENIAFRNKFAIAPSDLTGKWTNDFSGALQYVNGYTGANAGMDTHASSQVYLFNAGGTYQWSLSVASGFVGNIKFQNVKSEGKFSLPGNWEIYFSDIEGKPRNYPAYFSCIKGARILWLDGTAFGLDTNK